VDGENGDSIYLLRLHPSGATEFVDAVKVPPLVPNVAYASARNRWAVRANCPDPGRAECAGGRFYPSRPGSEWHHGRHLRLPRRGTCRCLYDLHSGSR
jgi:hypothetical protein